MWTRVKNAGPTANRQSFSLVHQYIQHFNEVSGNKTAVIRRRSKTPGVMIMQYIINIPEGKSTPDFQCKPNPVTTTEGKSAIFTAVVTGDPKPEVSWKRARGNMSDKFHKRHDESTGEYILEIHNVSAADIDTYKCYAVNEYGKAIGTATLNVIEASSNPDFRNLLKKSKVERADGEMDERFWDVLLNADRKDHERVCTEFGVADLQLILKKLEAKKEERMQNKFKEKGAIPHEDTKEKQSLQCVRRTKDFSAMDTGLNQVDVKQINYHLTEFKCRS
uniref:immunoglobulin-like and fibronectin type III domain-containing protein 1 n=1 Tax=Monopterus albus TaxID=43700 RepID=UPI0009B2F91E|nr:immunoglobulin-like and fibronectin type III domain-containing protein 1 [Monopterus albus]